MPITKASFGVRRNRFNSWTERAPNTGTEQRWHLRMGHPGPEALNHLTGHSKGVRIKGPATVDCDACGCSKAKRKIRREPRQGPTRPGQRIAVDFLDLEPDEEGYWSVMLLTDRYSGYVFDVYLTGRNTDVIMEAFRYVLGVLDNQYHLHVEAIECDNEITKNYALTSYLTEDKHIRLEPSAPHTQSQNGGAERSGGVIKEKARSMRAGAKLPHFLWVEIYKAAVYLNNRTPKYHLRWQTPYESFYTYLVYRDGIVVKDRKPSQAHLRAYGCKAFAMTADAHERKNRRQKLNPKAWIGYLVGYNSTNIYRVWNPLTNDVIAVRDVSFNEDEFFSGNVKDLKDDLLHTSEEQLAALLRDVRLNQPTHHPPSVSTQEEDEELSRITQPPAEEEDSNPGGYGDMSHRVDPNDACTREPDPLYVTARFAPLLTPDATPPSAGALMAATIREFTERQESAARPYEEVERCRQPKELATPGTIQLLVPAGEDLRAIRHRHGNWEAAFNAGRLASPIGMIDGKRVTKDQFMKIVNGSKGRPSGKELHKTRSNGVVTVVPRRPNKIHRRDLPPPPKTHRDLESHPMGTGFKEAERVHLNSHKEMQSWLEISKDQAKGHQLLDCMWVYVYKFDKHGWFSKCKARLVVRGDQQAKSIHENTYASTLAGRSFRTLMAVAARFDLEFIQYDAVNAFVNAKLLHDVFMRMPPGYRKRGQVLHLKKALYGLRESPLLWQKDFTATLSRLGFSPVPHEPCCFSREGMLIFFYVDDIVVAYSKENQSKVEATIAELRSCYTLTGGHELQWFLGIEVIRDRARKRIWLSQSDYIDKLANLVTNSDGPFTPVPMKQQELFPSEDKASPSSINLYQRRVGSILYAAVITRVDIAFAASRLSRFNTNPGEQHHAAAEHLIRYLLGTKTLALELGGGDSLDTWSDASFADNTLDRKSSQAYVMKLFGGVIGWRANKQDTVTTSTTEAELLSLAQATKEAMFVSRLITELSVQLDTSIINIWCDNQQTIRLVNADVACLHTKLRHVDIHNHWLREAASKRQIDVAYTPTNDMLADGLTKALTTEKFRKFVQQLGLVDVQEKIQSRKLKELQDEDFQEAEECIEGGESDWVPG